MPALRISTVVSSTVTLPTLRAWTTSNGATPDTAISLLERIRPITRTSVPCFKGWSISDVKCLHGLFFYGNNIVRVNGFVTPASLVAWIARGVTARNISMFTWRPRFLHSRFWSVLIFVSHHSNFARFLNLIFNWSMSDFCVWFPVCLAVWPGLAYRQNAPVAGVSRAPAASRRQHLTRCFPKRLQWKNYYWSWIMITSLCIVWKE